MKKNQNLRGHRQNLNDSEKSLNPKLTHVFKLGLDVDLKNLVTAIQCDHGREKEKTRATSTVLLTTLTGACSAWLVVAQDYANDQSAMEEKKCAEEKPGSGERNGGLRGEVIQNTD